MPRHTFACMSDVDYLIYLFCCHNRKVLTILYTTYYLQLCHYIYLGNVVSYDRKLLGVNIVFSVGESLRWFPPSHSRCRHKTAMNNN